MNHTIRRLIRTAPGALVLALGALLGACQENPSSIGIQYYNDTVSYRTDTIASSGSIFSVQPTGKPTVTVSGVTYNETWASPLILVGRAKAGTEDIESWGVLRFRTVTADTLAKVTSVRLLLHTVAYRYGPDSTNANVDFQVYAQQGGGTIADSSTTINTSELSTTPVGQYTGALADSTGTLVAIPVDPAEIPKLIATSYAFVIEPGTSMNHVRGFSSSEDATGTGPQIEYTMKTDTGNVVFTRTPVLDMHVVRDNSTTPAGEIELRGSIGKRAAVNIDLRHIADSLGLTQFSTINRAVIELHVDAANSRRSSLTVDTNGPSLVRITGVGDTARSFYGVMSRDPLQTDVYRITCGNLIELWLRDSTSFHGLEIWSWSNNRYFAVGYGLVDDNTLNRWCFYGTDAADPTKRPRLYVSHSTLK